jgi:hypothetical protein
VADANDELRDRFELEELPIRYADILTRRRPEELGRVFAEDAVWILPGIEDTVGIDAIVPRLAGVLEGYPFLTQNIDGSLIKIDGDRARGRSYITEWGRDSTGMDVKMLAVYEDEMVRTPDGWRFSKREVVFLYRGRREPVGKFYPTDQLSPWD